MRPGAEPKLSTVCCGACGARCWVEPCGAAMGHVLRCGTGPRVGSQGPRLEVLSCYSRASPPEKTVTDSKNNKTAAPPLIRNASAKRSRPGRGRPGVAPAGSVYGAVISGRFCVGQDLNIDLGPKSSSGPGFDIDHIRGAAAGGRCAAAADRSADEAQVAQPRQHPGH